MGSNDDAILDSALTPRTFEDFWSLAMATESIAAIGDAPEILAATESAPVDREAEVASEAEIMDAIKLDVLGSTDYNKARVFSLHHRKIETISNISNMKLENLLEIAGLPARQRVFEGNEGDTPPGMYSMTQIRRAIAMLAGYRKLTDESELGPGCWGGVNEDGELVDGVILVGNREAADYDAEVFGKITHPRCRGRILNFESGAKPWYEYKQLAEYFESASDPAWRIGVMNECINLFSRWRWKDGKTSPIVLTGLVFATWVQTLWNWRPLVSVVGATSSGKSIFCHAVAGLFGNLSKTCSDSTEAGIRQIIENSARIILYDEFDTKDRKKQEEQTRIQKMLRASGRGDSIFRGTAGQKGKEFTLRHIVWLLGINISVADEADRNRYITSELLPATEALKGKLIAPPASELRVLGQKMLAVAVHCVGTARKVAVALKDTQVEGVVSRVVESYSVPAAMLAAVHGSNDAEARELLREMLSGVAGEDREGTSDEQILIADIFGAQVQIGPDRFSVAQLLENVIKLNQNYERDATALESRGIKLDRFTLPGTKSFRGERCILIACQLANEYLIKGTRWGNTAIDQILRRIPTAVQARRRVGGQRVQTIGISLDYVGREFLGMDGMEIADYENPAAGGDEF
jgi:hypothetical protein